MLYFHLWEFADLSGYQLQFYVKRRGGEKLLRRLDRLIQELKNSNVQLVSCDRFCDHCESERVDWGAK